MVKNHLVKNKIVRCIIIDLLFKIEVYCFKIFYPCGFYLIIHNLHHFK